MSKKQALIRGTFILTFTGFATRFIGFFYRIFLSHTFGEEGVGLYQLIFPVYALCFSLTAAGIETALSRFVAKSIAMGNRAQAKFYFSVSLTVSMVLSCICMVFLQAYSLPIAVTFLGDERCAVLISAMAYSFPFASLHSCICGYYLGLKQTKAPAVSQFAEQITRIGFVYLACMFAAGKGIPVTISFAVYGLVFGEMISSAVSFFYFRREPHTGMKSIPFREKRTLTGRLIRLSIPLTTNRILLNLLQGIEAAAIPHSLQLSGHTVSEALSVYGVLTGMALPCILFPSAITNSLSTMMLPAVAELQISSDRRNLLRLIKKVCAFCVMLGLLCMAVFLALGTPVGKYIFHSESAGRFITTLAWMCPFMYLNSALLSVLNGLGKTGSTLVINTSGLTIRILCVFLLIPYLGIIGYLWGLLASQVLVTLLSGLCLTSAVKRKNQTAL